MLLDVQDLRGAGCDIDQYLLVAKDADILPISKRAAQSVKWRDLFSRRWTSWKLNNSTRLK
jgi:hypothetical protein